MASILDKYGIKEVCDLTFYTIKDDGTPDVPVLYVDSAKVSTAEITADETSATGGKGNAKLITWDYNKEITVTIEDALFSAKSMAVMFGNGSVTPQVSGTLKRTVSWVATSGSDKGKPKTFNGPQGKEYTIPAGAITYDSAGSVVTDSSGTGFTAGETYYTTFDMPVINVSTIEVSADEFPGTYYVTGDTYARKEATGVDEFFQLIFPKAKIQPGNTITLEAEGDPSVFNLNLTVLRPADGVMMKLVKYDMEEAQG